MFRWTPCWPSSVRRALPRGVVFPPHDGVVAGPNAALDVGLISARSSCLASRGGLVDARDCRVYDRVQCQVLFAKPS